MSSSNQKIIIKARHQLSSQLEHDQRSSLPTKNNGREAVNSSPGSKPPTTIQPTKEDKKRAKYKKKRQQLKDKKSKRYQNKYEDFNYWTTIICAICQDSMRELYEDNPLDINEQYNTNVIQLPCEHKFHHNCFGEWYKQQKKCPYCRGNSQLLDYDQIKHITLPPLPCRAVIRHSKDPEKVGKQCECLEHPGNIGFCKKHLVCLDEIHLSPHFKTSNLINLVNRRLLTKLKLENFKDFPSSIRGELLGKAVKVLEKEPEATLEEVLLKIETIES